MDTTPTPIVQQIVNRLHVGTSNLEVLRYVRSRLSDEGKSAANWPRRKEIYAQAITQHEINRSDYVWVMGPH